MEMKLWEKCQLLVNAGMGHLVIHLYQKELTDNLTPEQLQKLGDIPSLLEKMMEKETNMKNVIFVLIQMVQQGAILGTKE